MLIRPDPTPISNVAGQNAKCSDMYVWPRPRCNEKKSLCASAPSIIRIPVAVRMIVSHFEECSLARGRVRACGWVGPQERCDMSS